VFLLLTTLAYAASVWLVWRQCDGLRPYAGVVAIVATAAPAFLALVRYAQLSAASLLLLSASLAAYRHGRLFVAGALLGTLAFKPQLALVFVGVLVAAREWRVVAGAAVAGASQILLAWAIAGTPAMRQYGAVLWRLAMDPSLVQVHPTEVHSLRGFIRLLAPESPWIGVVSVLALVLAVIVGLRVWTRTASATLRWGVVVMVTVLISPHLLTYDLVLLAIPVLAFADWAVTHRADPRQRWVARLLLLSYLAPFSGNVARLVPIQLSVVVIALLTWAIYAVVMRPQPEPIEAR
jgi:hypothetical protein